MTAYTPENSVTLSAWDIALLEKALDKFDAAAFGFDENGYRSFLALKEKLNCAESGHLRVVSE